MIILKFSNKNQTIIQVEEKLRELSLAFQLREEPDLHDIQLEDGNTTAIGIENIQHYIKELEAELKTWYYGSC